MGPLISILLAANLIVASVAVPLSIAGIGFGSGAAGSSFYRETNLLELGDDRKAAGIILKASCDEGTWSANASKANAPSISQVEEIAKQAKNLDWNSLCKPKGTSEKLSLGIQYRGVGVADEMKLLFTGKWDRRVLFALTYLYQKRFPGGYGMDCFEEGKGAPDMTVAVHAEAGGTSGLGDLNFRSVSEDDDNAAADPSYSPHGRGQAIDIVTFGCVIIRDKDGKVQEIVPNVLASAQAEKAKNTSQNASDVYGSLSSTGLAGISADQQISLALGALDSGSPFELAQDLISQNKLSPLSLISGLPASFPDEASLFEAVLSTESGKLQEELGAKLMEYDIEKKLGLPAGALQGGEVALERIGMARLKEIFGFDPAGAYEQYKKAPENYKKQVEWAEKIISGGGGFSLGVPDEAFKFLEKKDFNKAAIEIGKSLVKDGFGSASKKDSTGLTAALLKGGLPGLQKKIEDIDFSRESETLYKFALGLQRSGRQAADQLEAIKQFLNGFKEVDPVLAQGAKDGGIRNFKGSEQLQSLMRESLNMDSKEALKVLSLVERYEKASDREIFINEQISPYRDQLVMTAYGQLPQGLKSGLDSAFGGTPLSFEKLEAAYKDGSLRRYVESAQIARLAGSAGLSPSDVGYLTKILGQKGKISTATQLDFLNQKYPGLELGKDDFKIAGEIGFANRPEAIDKIAAFSVAGALGLEQAKIESALKGGAGARAELAKAFASSQGIPSFAVDFAADIFSTSSQGGSVKAMSKSAANLKAKDIANKSAEGADRESLNNQLKEKFNSAVDKAEIAAEKGAAKLLQSHGIGQEDAQKIAEGNFRGSHQAALAAGISRSGLCDYQTAKDIARGELSKDGYYSIGDDLLGRGIEIDGFVYNPPDNTMKVLVEGMMKDDPSTAENEQMTRADIAKDLYSSYGANKLVEQANKLGVKISPEQAKQILKSDGWGVLGDTSKDAAILGVSDRISQQITLLSRGNLKISGDKISEMMERGEFSELDDLARQAGKQRFAGLLTENSMGVLDKDKANQIIKAWGDNPGAAYGIFENAASDFAQNRALDYGAGQVSNLTGGLLGSADIKSLYGLAGENGLTTDELEGFSWEVLEERTGFSEEAFSNLDGFGKSVEDKLLGPYQNMDFAALGANLGAGVIVGTLLGPTLMQLDPTGGLLAGFAMSWATSYLAAVGGPYLLAVAFIINPQAVIQSIQAMFNQAVMIFTNPIGFLMSMFSLFGLGKKPKAESPIKNKTFQSENKLEVDILQNESEGDKNKEQKPDDGYVDAPLDGGDRPSDTLVFWRFFSKKAQAASTLSQRANSYYLPAKKPTQEFLKKVSRRTIDQIVEDLLIFSLVKKSDQYLVKNHWQEFMAGIKPPETNYKIGQLVAPRISADPTNPKISGGFQDFMYKGEFDAQVVGLGPLVERAKAVYGEGFDPLTVSKRKPGLLYSLAIPDRIHAGY